MSVVAQRVSLTRNKALGRDSLGSDGKSLHSFQIMRTPSFMKKAQNMGRLWGSSLGSLDSNLSVRMRFHVCYCVFGSQLVPISWENLHLSPMEELCTVEV